MKFEHHECDGNCNPENDPAKVAETFITPFGALHFYENHPAQLTLIEFPDGTVMRARGYLKRMLLYFAAAAMLDGEKPGHVENPDGSLQDLLHGPKPEEKEAKS